MKCPKCGYNSFESYDSCKKCSADLVSFKQTHGITPVVLPPSLRAGMAAALGDSRMGGEQPEESAGEMFSFELPTEQRSAPSAPQATSADPFAFAASPAPAPAFSFDSPAPVQEDPFAALLESSPQLQPAPVAQPAAPEGLELNSFSWDDTLAPGQEGAPADGEKKSDDDDFNSLFGGLASGDKK